MNSPRVSIIIPAYRQAEFLGAAIQSGLDQTYPDLEVIVVNDNSPDETDAVVRKFHDPRVKYIVHDRNRGLPAARNTGIRASSGEIIALLDADDLFHPDKIQVHVDFLHGHPEIGTTYNGRFELDLSSTTIHELVRPPRAVSLSDLVLGFPFAPSDMVLRRDWAFQVGLFDESYVLYSEDLDINCRLALAGCRFASVDRPLTYRGRHRGRAIRNVSGRLEAALRALSTTFADPRCPEEVQALRDRALANHYMAWSYRALAQEEPALGQRFLREAVRLNPSLLDRGGHGFLTSVVRASMRDGGEHEPMLRRLFSQLPPELSWLSDRRESAIARGYLLRGGRDAIWGRSVEARDNLERAARLGATADPGYLGSMVDQLLNYEDSFGATKLQIALEGFSRTLAESGLWEEPRRIHALYSITRAFRDYNAGRYSTVPGSVLRGALKDPTHLLNRGVASVFLRSSLKTWRGTIARAGGRGDRTE